MQSLRGATPATGAPAPPRGALAALAGAMCFALLLGACAQGTETPRSSQTAEPETTGGGAATPATGNPGRGVDLALELQGIRFRITCPNDSSVNVLTITPSGLEIDNSPIEREVDGSVVGAEIDDLDADGSPEVYVYLQSAGSGAYGSLIAYSANRRKSLSEIYLPPVAGNPEAAQGHMGHDEFAVVEGNLVQRFPIYLPGDTNEEPTGGMRQLQYKLEAGEAGWVLRLDRMVEY